jgi:Sel1 repeat-containing protein
MITDLTELDARLGQYEPGMILVGPLDKAAPAPIPKPSISSDEVTGQAAAAALPLVADELTKANKLAEQPAPAPVTVPPAPLSQPSQVARGQAGAASIAEAQSPPATASIVEAQSRPATDGPATRHIDAEEIVSLINRGKGFLQSGDFASARLLLLRAAEAGDASAALLLGSTFDPRVIQQLHAVGIPGDVAQARRWYQKAAELGSADAVQQLAKLGQAGQ